MNNIKNMFFLVLVISIIGCSTHSEYTYFLNEKDTVRVVQNIIEGDVINSSISEDENLNSCFSYVYKIKVTKVFKGNFIKGDIVNVGLNLNTIGVHENQKQLIFLNKLPTNYYTHCEESRAQNHPNLHITVSYTVGVFELFSNENKMYKGISCDKSVPVMYQEISKVSLRDKCIVIEGEYNSLVNNISVDLKGG